jgi:two-component system, chemotaxis family, protein-glutamate methylesterase/glutaminase
MARPELIVIGTSAGGLRPLQHIVRSLPANFPVCVLVVMHVSAESTLATILSRGAQVSVKQAETGDPIRAGVFYVAPPDQHMLVRGGAIELTRGPRENRARPAIDPLFRSAAVAYQERVIGVVLTGFLEDGAAGLLAIKRAGGVAVVQDPQDAEFPNMPEGALARVSVDYCTTLRELPQLLAFLAETDRAAHVRRAVPQSAGVEGADAVDRERAWPIEPSLELEMLEEPVSHKKLTRELGPPVAMACPECGGPLWELHDEHVRRYRCLMGHGLTASMALLGQEQVVEHSLWVAARALEERASLLAVMAADEQAAGREVRARDYSERAHKSRHSASALRKLLSQTDFAPGPLDLRGLKDK